MDNSIIEAIKESEQTIKYACKGIDMDSAFLEKAIALNKIFNDITLLGELGITLNVYSEGDLLAFHYEYNEDSYKFTLDKF